MQLCISVKNGETQNLSQVTVCGRTYQKPAQQFEVD